MSKVQLGYGDITLGKPLPFELLDAEGRVLLKYGYILDDAAQLERLIERGVFCDAFSEDTRTRELVKQISVFRLVLTIATTYQDALATPFSGDSYTRLQTIAGEIGKLCALDADAALSIILLYKDSPYAIRHGFSSAILTHVLMQELKQPDEEVARAVLGALCMNLSMLELQNHLYAQNTPLSPEQKKDIVLHPKRSARLLAEHGCTDTALLSIVEDHHELINGSGYAGRKSAPDIRLSAQVVSLADRYCAVVSERAYRPASPPNIAARDLLSRQAATIDTLLAAHFLRVVGIYPPGTVVTLANGEVAVAIRRTLHPAQPIVRSLRSRNGIRFLEPPKRNTSKESFAIKGIASTDLLQGVDLASLWPPVETETD